MNKAMLVPAIAVLALVSTGAYLGVAPLFVSKESAHESESRRVPTARQSRQIICSGRVESVNGEIEICAQLAGQVAELRVTDGDAVAKDQVVAVIDARRQSAEVAIAEAGVALAKARLKRVLAGSGEEEIREAQFAVQAAEALLDYETGNLQRQRKLHEQNAISEDEVERSERQVEHLSNQRASLQQRHAALRRGPIVEEIVAAEAEVALAERRLSLAQVNHDYRFVRAPTAGTVVTVYRHTGDSVALDEITPILRMVDASKLRVRLEIEEADVSLVKPGMEGDFQVRGISDKVGRFRVTTVIPEFGPKRLFNPDTSALVDTRTLSVLCELISPTIRLHPGQRITAFIPIHPSTVSASSKQAGWPRG